MYTRITLSYITKQGGKIRLYNLLEPAVRKIVRAQSDLGSYDFQLTTQPYNYSQDEIDTLERSQTTS